MLRDCLGRRSTLGPSSVHLRRGRLVIDGYTSEKDALQTAQGFPWKLTVDVHRLWVRHRGYIFRQDVYVVALS